MSTDIGAARTTGIPADTFANRLMLARAQAGHISIREAAELCGVGRGAWTNWEKGARPESYEDLTDLIAERLGCDRDWLRHGGSLRPVDDRPARAPRWRRTHSPSPWKTSAADRPMPARPIDGRAPGHPVSRRPPPGPGRTSRVQHPPAA